MVAVMGRAREIESMAFDVVGGKREETARACCACVDVTWKREKSGDCDCNE